MSQAQSLPQRRPLLRVGRVVTAAFKYIWKDAGRLFLITWFACLLTSLTRLLLDWLSLPWPSPLPDWMLSEYFDPPTWLTAFLLTPWLAMGWAFVLNEMAEEGTRGAVTTRARELPWLRFELSRSILIAAAILTAVALVEAGTRFAQLQIASAIAEAFNPSDFVLTLCMGLLTGVRVLVMVTVFVFVYPLAGIGLHTGTFSVSRTMQMLRGNWLRIAVIFLLVSIILRVVYRLIQPAANWLIERITDTDDWTLQAALVRFVLDFPFQMLWIVAWGVVIGIILHTLDPGPADSGDGRRTT